MLIDKCSPETRAMVLRPESGLARPEMVRQAVVRVAHTQGKLDLIAAELLCEVRDKKYFLSWGHETFDEYLDAEVPFKRRKAFYIMGIYDKFKTELQIPDEELQNVEWSKAKEIKDVITKDNYQELLEEIKEKTVPEVLAKVRAMKGPVTLDVTDEDKVQIVKTFQFSRAQNQNIEAALAVASNELESDKEGHLLDAICTDYLASRPDAEGREGLAMRLQVLLDNIQRVYKVELAVVKIEEQND